MANKKINQLVSKTAILSTDLFGIGDATTGQLFKKTIAELQAAIGGAVISVNGLVGTVVLDTDDVQELASPTNKYFTDARARAAISLTVTGNSGASTYSSGTGVLNVPTYTLAGLGGITAAFLSGTSGISYNSTTGVISYSGTVYTDASIRALLSGGTGITYNSSTGAISYSGTVYTDSSVRALISLTTTGTSGASTYNNTTGVINVPEYTLAGLGGISLTSLSGGTGITYSSSTGAISYSGTVYTDASIRALFSASGSVSYNNTTGVISLTGGNLTEATSSVLTITGGSGAVIGGGTSIQVKQATTSISGFLSSTDWTTFNNKQATITLTTTGTSGAATFSSNTLNIPQYASALSGTTNYVAKFTSSTGIGNSNIQDNGSIITLGMSQITIGTSGSQFFIYPAFSANLNLLQNYNGSAYTTEEHRASDYNFKIGTTSALTIASTGAATFSSSVTAGGTITSTSSSGVSFLNSSITTNNAYIRLVGSAHGFIVGREGSAGGQIFTGASAYASVIGSESTDPLQFATNNTVKMTLTSNGNVGIGTASPIALLNIYGSNQIQLQNSTTGALASDGTRIQLSGSDLQIINRETADIILYTTDTERMRITSAGNIGINWTSTAAKLNISTNVNGLPATSGTSQPNAALRLRGGDNAVLDMGLNSTTTWIQATDLSSLGTYYTLALQPNGGNVGIGTTSPTQILHTYIATGSIRTLTETGNTSSSAFTAKNSTQATDYGTDSTGGFIQTQGAYPLLIYTNGTDRGRVTSGGNWLLGTSSDNGERLYVSGAIRATGTITANSDLTLKKNLLRIENALEKVEQINGYTYEFKADDSKRHAGVIAQEIQTVLPEIVNKGNDGILGVEYGNISALLIEAIKEQNIKIKNLETLLASK